MNTVPLLAVLLCVSPLAEGKLVVQEARTRSLCQDMEAGIVPIADVRVKVETEERSDTQGRVQLKISDNSKGTFFFRELRKSGYTLISPTEDEIAAQRHFPLNKQAPIDIILADKLELEKHKEQIVSLYQGNYESSIRELEQQLEQEKDQAKRAALSQQLQGMYDQYESIMLRIQEEADKLAKIDYLSLDESARKSVELRKQGKADELISLNLSLLPADHEAQTHVMTEAIKTGQEQLAEKKALASYWAQLYHNVAYGHQMKFDYHEVARWLEKCCELDSQNFLYKLEYAKLVSDYLANHHKALELYQSALPLVKAQIGEQCRQAADIYAAMAESYVKLSQPKEALECINQAQKITEELSTYRHPFSSVIYSNNVAGVYFAQGNYEKALDAYFQAVGPFEIHLGVDHPSVLSCYHNVIVCYVALNQYERALHYSLKLDALYAKQQPRQGLSRASHYITIALVYRKLKRYQTALDYLTKAESIYKKDAASHPMRAIALYHRGKNDALRGDRDLALTQFLMANELFDSLTAHHHHEGIEIGIDLGDLYNRAGEHDKALALYKDKLSRCAQVLGEKHLTTAILHHHAAQAYLKMANPAQSLSHYKQSLDMLDELYDEPQLIIASCLMDMGQLCVQMGRLDEALRCYYRALVVRFVASQHDKQLMAECYHAIASVYLIQQRYDDALKEQRKALDLAQQQLGAKHAFSLDCLISMGLIHDAKGDKEAALRAYKDALALSSPEHSQGKINRLLGLVYQKNGEHAEALAHFQQALEIYSQLEDKPRDEIIFAHYNVGKTHLLMEQPEKAREHLSLAYQEACAFFGDDGAATRIIRQCLDQCPSPQVP